MTFRAFRVIYIHNKRATPKTRRKTKMRTTYKLDNKRISKKALTEMIGAKLVTRFTRCDWCDFTEDPNIENKIWIGIGTLTIHFK